MEHSASLKLEKFKCRKRKQLKEIKMQKKQLGKILYKRL